MNVDYDRLIHDLEKLGEAWADANAAAEALEETRKSVFAVSFMMEASGAIGLREHAAAASEVYRKHIDNMVMARKAANRARVKYDVKRVEIELVRSRIATERAAMNLR